MATGSGATSASAALFQSLIDYVNDVKPYRTKLSTIGAIAEEYFFSDSATVTLTDNQSTLTFLGADMRPTVAIPGLSSARQSQDWWRTVTSDGSRSTWPLPQVSIPIFASSANLQNFTCGTNDYQEIAGLPLGAFDPKRWDGPGITNVSVNGIHQQDTVHYTLSHGIYSFNTVAGGNWIESDLTGISAFGINSGALTYYDVARSGGTISAISNGNYEEWTITTTYVNYTTTNPQSPAQASVVGSISGNIGTAIWGQQFTSSKISFFWGPAPGETIQTTEIGDIWILTPANKVTVSTNAPVETWSLIKSNPIALSAAPVFTPAVTRNDTPVIEIHTRSLDHTTEQVNWTITFNGDGTYSLDRVATSNPNNIAYPLTIDLVNGCSFKNADIAFTLIPTATGWNKGDTFTWSTKSSTSNFKVYGSISGWQDDAIIGQWYWNGKIGFKIPSLSYFVDSSLTNNTGAEIIVPVNSTVSGFTALSLVSSMIQPSTYIITFTTATNGITPATATVENTVYGFRAGLTQGQIWADEYVSFRIDTAGNFRQYNVGDVIQVHIAPSYTYAANGGYESQPYEEPPYDIGSIDTTTPLLINQEYFPLYYGYGAVIWHKSANAGIGTTLTVGDKIIIDKAFFNNVELMISNASVKYPELGAIGDWVPLELRYFDNINQTPVAPNQYTPTSTADFSDLATYIQAYSAANPDKLVFSIFSPRYLRTNYVASSQLTFDSTFFSDYLGFGNQYSLRVDQDETYAQKIRVKISETLKLYASINLDLTEIISTSIVDNPIGSIDFSTNMFMGEGPSSGFWRYEIVSLNPVTWGFVQVTPATDPSDQAFTYPFTVNVIDSDTVSANEEPLDAAPSSVIEGLTILETTASTDYGYDLALYDQTIDVTIASSSPDGTAVTLSYESYILAPGMVLNQTATNVTGTIVTVNGASLTLQITSANTTWGVGAAIAYVPYDGAPDSPEFQSGGTRLSTIFDFALWQPTGWIAPPAVGSENYGMLITTAAEEYLITMINVPTGQVLPPTVTIESTSNMGTYITPTINTTPIYPQVPNTTSSKSFTFVLPLGFVAPFRMWLS